MDRDWFRHGTIYQIYPQSFCDDNGDGFGDIAGIIKKQDYLASLGIDAVWISPMYDSPYRDNGYDVRDYYALDSRFGTMEEFERMIEGFHKRGIKVIMDMVINHSSNECEWFKKAAASKDSPEHDMYIWRKGKDGLPPTNWEAIFSGSAWTYVPECDEWYLGTFSPYQPDFNWENENVRKTLFEMTEFWLKKGVDGFRMDAINFISKNTQFPDGPSDGAGLAPIRPFVQNGPKAHEWLGEFKKQVLDKYGAMTVGEADGTSAAQAIEYSKEMDMIFSFDHVALDNGENFTFNASADYIPKLKTVLAEWQTKLYKKAWNALFWENHDQPRIVTRLGDSHALREASAKALAVALFFLQGTPFIFQGQELGNVNTVFTRDEVRDIQGKNNFRLYVDTGIISEEKMLEYINYKSRDTVRAPMQWTDGENSGFGGTPWIKTNGRKDINVREQESREGSVLNFYRKLIAIRKNNGVIENGTFKLYNAEHESVFEYTRTLNGKTIYVICNISKHTVEYTPSVAIGGGNVLIRNYENSDFVSTHTLQPFEAIALTL